MKYHQNYGRQGKIDDLLLQYCNAVYNQNTVKRWTKGCILLFSKKGDLEIAKKLPRYKPYFHSG